MVTVIQSTEKTYSVQGTIRDDDGIPLEGVKVTAIDKDLRTYEILGDDVTDKSGRYKISYSREKFSRKEKFHSDLQIIVGDIAQPTTSSPVHFNAYTNMTINVMVGNKTYAGYSEYEKFITTIEPLLEDFPNKSSAVSLTIIDKLAMIEENATNQDLSFLVGETKFPREHLEWLVASAKLEKNAVELLKDKRGIPAAVFYGFASENLPTQLEGIIVQDREILAQALRLALQKNIIPLYLAKQIDGILDQLGLLTIESHLQPESKLSRVLANVLPEVEKQKILLELYAKHPGTIEEFWQILAKKPGFDRKCIDQLQFSLQVKLLSNNHLPLIKYLQSLKSQNQQFDLYSLAEYSYADWLDIIQNKNVDSTPIGFPEDAPGKDDQEKAENYAKTLKQIINNAFPTAVFAARLKDDSAGDPRFNASEIAKFLNENKDFDFQHTIIDISSKRFPAHLVKSIKNIQRLFKLTTRYQVIKTLLLDNHHSAQSIVFIGKKAFIKKYETSFGKEEAELIYNRAQQTHATAMLLLTQYSSAFNSTDLHVLSKKNQHKEKSSVITPPPLEAAVAISNHHEVLLQDGYELLDVLDRDIKGVPNLITLFGSLNLCECKHCHSVYSPAAYMVDTLHFLSQMMLGRPIVEGEKTYSSVKDILFKRRPDIGEINLNCENAMTPLPYIDLVNEVLENAVSPSTGSYQTTELAEELSASPQYVNNHAYEKLKSSYYPITLPFHLPYKEIQSYLSHLETSHAELIERFQVTLPPLFSDINTTVNNSAAAYLGLTSQEQQIITAAENSGIHAWDLWGLKENANTIIEPIDRNSNLRGHWLSLLSQVRVLLYRAKLDYGELKKLLDTSYVNPQQTITIESSDLNDVEQCDINKLYVTSTLNTIAERNQDLASAFTRLHRLVRLQHKLGWTTGELDKVLKSTKVDDAAADVLTFNTLQMLTHLDKLQKKLKLSITELLSFWKSIDTTEDQTIGNDQSKPISLYNKLFQNKLKTNPINPDFALNQERTELENSTLTIAERHKETLLSVLKVNATDLELLLNTLPTNDNSQIALNLSNISYLYRQAIFAKALKLTISDFVGVKELVKNNTFNSISEAESISAADTTKLLNLIEKVQGLKNSPFTIPELNYLLNHQFEPSATFAPKTSAITATLSDIRTTLKKIDTTYKTTTSINAEELKTRLVESQSYSLTSDQLIDQLVKSLNETLVSACKVGEVEDLQLPAILTNRASYNATEKTLSYSGIMLLQERTALLRVHTDENYIAAINKLFNASRELLKQLLLYFHAPVFEYAYSKNNHLPEFSVSYVNKISYDSDTEMLTFKGVMTSDEKGELQKLLADEVYQNAINAFYRLGVGYIPIPANQIMTPDEIESFFDESIRIDESIAILENQIPSQFPEVLSSYINYDPEAGKLSFTDLMTEVDKKVLLQLADTIFIGETDDEGINAETEEARDKYRKAIETLFYLSYEQFEQQKAKKLDDLRLAVTNKLKMRLQSALSEKAIIEKLSTVYGLDNTIMGFILHSHKCFQNNENGIAILTQEAFRVGASEILAANCKAQIDVMARVNKLTLFISKFALNLDEIVWLHNLNDNSLLDITALPYEPLTAENCLLPFLHINALLQLRGSYPEVVLTDEQRQELPTYKVNIFDVVTLFKNGNHDNCYKALHFLTDWDVNISKQMYEHFRTVPLDVRLYQMNNAFNFIQNTGIPFAVITTFIGTEVDRCDTPLALTFNKIVQANYAEEQWASIAKSLRDDLREKQRSALVDYLTSNSIANDSNITAKTRFLTADDLYEHYLIDVEMSACQLTSRIVQANSAIQLFVQRCFLNLEATNGIQVDVAKDPEWQQWEWMKNYRVWEANRKVFLYPENWIEPELRDNKTPFFEELENELMQNDITADTAETAFLHYLEKLDEVARLDIRAIYHEINKDPDKNILHVIGRTYSFPHVYYYRQWINQATWTPWEKIDVDIEGNHLLVITWNRRLYLFWPTFSEKAEEINHPVEGSSPKKYWEVKLAWSEYKNKKWAPKKITSSFLVINSYMQDNSIYPFRIMVDVNNSLKVWSVYCNGAWLFTGNNSEASIVKLSEATYWMEGFSGIVGTEKIGELCREFSNNGKLNLYQIDVEQKKANNKVLLKRTPGTYWLTPSYQAYGDDTESLFFSGLYFFQDDTRTYFIKPVMEIMCVWESLRNNFKIDIPMYDPPPYLYHDDPLTSPLPIGPGPDIDPLPFEDGARIAIMPRAVISEEVPARSNHYMITKNNYKIAMPVGTFSPKLVEKFSFQTFYHPYSDTLIKELNRFGINGLLNRDIQRSPTKYTTLQSDFNFDIYYDINTDTVASPSPKEDIDFESAGAYSMYNWELFFHVPLLIAVRLSNNQKFAEAQRWFHYVFNPTDTSNALEPQRFWQNKPFFETQNERYLPEQIANLLRKLASGFTDESLENQVEAWREHPFNPHLIARFRTVAYQKMVVMKYLDNLIAWADQLFRRDSMESINEATMLYILAAKILGPKPISVPSHSEPETQNYNQLEEMGLDEFGNVGLFGNIVATENIVPTVNTFRLHAPASFDLQMPSLLYFCIPQNERLLKYWDTVADRLFKIRHCMNIEGAVRQLALFEPPIDPALLVKATAAGIDIGSVLNDFSAPLPHYRYSIMQQKAQELCNEVKSLGAVLLSALEKRDAEALSLLRSNQEIKLLTAIRNIKETQLKDAKTALDGLMVNKQITEIKHQYYRDIDKINKLETTSLTLNGVSSAAQLAASLLDMFGGGVVLFPDVIVGGAGSMGTPLAASIVAGGTKSAGSAQSWSRFFNVTAGIANTAAAMTATLGSYERRWNEWKLQEHMAEKELIQIDKQILGAELRVAIAEKELQNHDLQIENAKTVGEYMRTKFTNKQLYDWMVSQLSALYFQSYQLAYDMSKRAQKAFQHELMLPDANYIQFGYWDSLKKGLLAGEKLYFDLKRMDVAYLEKNKREFEITKHISLALLDPLALMKLKETGECFIKLDEALFDADYPGHFCRRVKNLSLTIPCIVGPYTSVNCTLTLLKHSIRHDNSSAGEYARALDGDDNRFIDSNAGGLRSVVTSKGQNDHGMFELSFRDERYLPFEYAGVISEWRLELPKVCNQLDFSSISDVIITINYTSRFGNESLKKLALQSIMPKQVIKLFSAKQDFANQWQIFQQPTQQLDLDLQLQRFPFIQENYLPSLSKLELYVKTDPDKTVKMPKFIWSTLKEDGTKDSETEITLSFKPLPGKKHLFYTRIPEGSCNFGKHQLQLENSRSTFSIADIEDMYLVCCYELTEKE